MKKAYAVYLVVCSILLVIGGAVLISKVNKVKADFAAQDAYTAQAETVVAQTQAQPAAPVDTTASAAAQKASAEQTAKIQAELAKLAINTTTKRATPTPPPPKPHYYAPSCGDAGNLVQAVNPNERATPYTGQLLVSRDGRKGGPCYGTGRYEHVTLGTFSVGRHSRTRLSPGTYPAPGGTITIERR